MFYSFLLAAAVQAIAPTWMSTDPLPPSFTDTKCQEKYLRTDVRSGNTFIIKNTYTFSFICFSHSEQLGRDGIRTVREVADCDDGYIPYVEYGKGYCRSIRPVQPRVEESNNDKDLGFGELFVVSLESSS